MELSVVAPIEPVDVPPPDPNTIAEPPLVNVLPAASFAVRVRVTPPPDGTVDAAAVITDVPAEMTPGRTVTVGRLDVIAALPTVAPIVVALPAVTPVKPPE